MKFMSFSVKIKKLTQTAKIPEQATKGDAGYDLFADISTMMISNCSVGSEIIHAPATTDGTSPNMNFELITWNNEIHGK